jgi:hypothetical protein
MKGALSSVTRGERDLLRPKSLRRRIWSNNEKIAALAPIPNASEAIATTVTNGDLNRVRTARRRLPMADLTKTGTKEFIASLPRRTLNFEL